MHNFLNFLMLHFPYLSKPFIQENLFRLLDVFEGLLFFWLVIYIVKCGKLYLLKWAKKNEHAVLGIVVPAVSNSIYALVFLIMVNIVIPILDLTPLPAFLLKKISTACLIGMIGWLIIQIVFVLDKFIINQYVINNNNSFNARKIHTQLSIIKRVIITMIIIVVTASILMLFDSVKNLGTSILTTAGIISAIAAFASQQSLGRIFSGLVMVFTQPIRIGDTVIINNEFGQVEEISLSYVVIKLWDLRRLILSTDHLMDKGLQNLTLQSSELLGTIFIYTDYTLPVESVRKKFFELLNETSLWNKGTGTFQVTDIQKNCMEIRGLMSANNSGELWNLRCNIREKLIKFIVQQYPECLVRERQILVNSITSKDQLIME
jgi:small-conductance mechanosensitive channel